MRLILSISSDIGTALALNWLETNEKIAGTYRTWSQNCDMLQSKGVKLIHCDFDDSPSIRSAIETISKLDLWDVMTIAPGDQNPIGLFSNIDYEDWERSISINFLKPVGFVRQLLHRRNLSGTSLPTVIMFAGGATNSATSHYSAYTISKIALMKIVELLDFEIPDCKFVIIGPGWVESKIHNATIEAGPQAGDNFEKTLNMRNNNLMNPMSLVVDACNWAISKPKEVVGGRNFSAVYDDFSSEQLQAHLLRDINLFKLRRSGNGIYERN